jgi:hypothetical protein
MATLSTSAWILHDLGMAAGFGGTLFGKAALDPAVKEIGSKEERFRVLDDAWGRFRVLDVVALGAMAATWLTGRKAFSGRRLGRSIRNLVVAKDVLVGGALITGVASLVAGSVMHRQQRRHGRVPVTSGYEPSPQTPPAVAKAERFLAVVGPINAAFVAGAIAVNAALAQESGKSGRWSVVSRLLP